MPEIQTPNRIWYEFRVYRDGLSPIITGALSEHACSQEHAGAHVEWTGSIVRADMPTARPHELSPEEVKACEQKIQRLRQSVFDAENDAAQDRITYQIEALKANAMPTWDKRSRDAYDRMLFLWN